MKKVILTKGLPASGKSTWAKNLQDKNPGKYKRVNKDDLRAMLDNNRWSKHNEKFVLKTRDAIILDALENGQHVIVDDTNLHQKHEAHIKELVKGKATVEVKRFDVSVDECIKRDVRRANGVGEKVIRSMHQQFVKEAPKPVEMDEDLPRAIIVDVDGTLAKMNGRSPFDWSKVIEDRQNENVADMVKLLRGSYKTIICTGRDGVCEQDTKEWLKKHGIVWDEFHIRPEGNTEKDSVIKRRVLEDVTKRYNIVGVFDDRDQVVEMWRDAGLTCLQVDYGDF